MRAFAKAACLALITALLCIFAAGCGGSDDTVNTSSMASKQSQSSSVAAIAADGTPLFDFISQEEPSFSKLGTLVESGEIALLAYSRDEHDDVTTSDKSLIGEVYRALAQIIVTGPYTEDVVVTDSNEYISFQAADGETFNIHFDFGNLVLNGEYYETANAKAFASAITDMELQDDGLAEDVS